jgi:hypothetical protein
MLSLSLSAMLNALSATPPHGRMLSYTSILNYNPGSKVTDHANIDLDQAALESELGTLPQGYANAKDIYENGAHSKPTAVCTLVSPATLGQAVAKKDTVSFTTASGDAVTGKAYSDYVTETSTVSFTYPVSSARVQPVDTQCYVGGLDTGDISADGCIAGSSNTSPSSGSSAGESTFTIAGTTYTATCINKGKRTLQSFSVKAQKYMYECPVDTTVSYENGCPYTSYKPYYDYYGVYDYANQIVLAALDGTTTATPFTNGAFDATGLDDAARQQFIKKGTSYMNAWMYVIREFEDAIDDCTSGDLTSNAMSSGPVHAWDEGVGFYTGSLLVYEDLLAGNLPTLDKKGKMPYTLANKRCKNFVTCGPDGDALIGEAKANLDLNQLFLNGQHELLVGNCAKVVPIKDDIVKKMTVPLVQGTLRYAYKMAHLSGAVKENAEGAVFAAAVLPQLHACDPAKAQTVYDNMKMGATADFMAVKAAFESCYESMGITCADIGGLWNSGSAAYYADGGSDASPCKDASTSDNDAALLGAIIAAAVIFVLCAIVILYMICKERSGKPIFTKMAPKQGA